MAFFNELKMDFSVKYPPVTFIYITAITFIVCLLNLPILESLWINSFDDGTYSHAFLVPLISFFLFFKASQDKKIILREKSSIGFILLLLASGALLFISSNAQISLGYWLSFLLIYLSSLLIVFRFNIYLIFPASYLIFLIPFWGSLVPLLQDMSVIVASFFMSWTNIPIFVEKQFITIPAGVFEIAGGCSGLRYLIVSLAISSLYIYLYIRRVKPAILFIMFSILGALLTNWIRITLLILIGHYTNMESSLMEDHNMFGWYIFIPFMFLLFWFGDKLIDTSLSTKIGNKANNIINHKNMIIVILATILFSTSFTYNLTSHNTNILPNTKNLTPTISNYTQYIISQEPSIELYTFLYSGKNLIHKPTQHGNNIIPEGWTLYKNMIINGWKVSYIKKSSLRKIVLSKYEIDGETATSAFKFKILRLKKALFNISETTLYWSSLDNNCKDSCQRLIEKTTKQLNSK